MLIATHDDDDCDGNGDVDIGTDPCNDGDDDQDRAHCDSDVPDFLYSCGADVPTDPDR